MNSYFLSSFGANDQKSQLKSILLPSFLLPLWIHKALSLSISNKFGRNGKNRNIKHQ